MSSLAVWRGHQLVPVTSETSETGSTGGGGAAPGTLLLDLGLSRPDELGRVTDGQSARSLRAGAGPGDAGRPVLLVAPLCLRNATLCALFRMEFFFLLQERERDLRAFEWQEPPLLCKGLGGVSVPLCNYIKGAKEGRTAWISCVRADSGVPRAEGWTSLQGPSCESRPLPPVTPPVTPLSPGPPGGLCSGAQSPSRVPEPRGPAAGSHLPLGEADHLGFLWLKLWSRRSRVV